MKIDVYENISSIKKPQKKGLGTLTDRSPLLSDAKNDSQRNKFRQAIRADPKLHLI